METYRCPIPEGEAGAWKVEKFKLTKEDLRFDFGNMKAGRQAVPGTYTKLTRNGECIMSDTPAELCDLSQLDRTAKGNVLIHGLGLGIAAELCLRNPEVLAVTVLEKDTDVMRLVWPTLRTRWGARLTVIPGDAFEFKPTSRFDVVWSDIWDGICADNLKEIRKLKRMWARYCEWHGFWCERECLFAARRERGYGHP